MNDKSADSSNESESGESRPSRFRAFLHRQPILFMLAFEVGLGLVAVVLALVFGLRPWLAGQFGSAALIQSLLATALLVAAMLALMNAHWAWVKGLERIVRENLLPLFRGAGPLAVFAVALMAGVCEELLFRGVIQPGLSGIAGPLTALLIASLLFGLAHAVSPAYFALTFLIGLYLGGLYQTTGNLAVPILVHFLYDWILLSWYLSSKNRLR